MRSLRVSCALLFGLLLSTPAMSTDTFTLADLMQQLAAATHPPRPFTEQRQSQLLAVPITLHGSLAFSDGRLVKHIQQPFDERFSVEGDTLLIEREGGAVQRLSLNDYPPLFTFVTVFRASLQGDLATLEEHYQTTFSGTTTAWRLQLRPRDAQVAVHLKGVEIAGTQDTISRFSVEEQSGDSSTLELGPAAP